MNAMGRKVMDTARAAAQMGVTRRSPLGSHLDFGDEARGWDFVSPGVAFDAAMRSK